MPSGFYRPESDIETIVGIQFGVFSPDEIERRSVVEVVSNGTYDGSEPKIGGLFDPRMGVIDNGKTCRSCGQSNHGCPGHFGHYRLARPVFYFQFLPRVVEVLSCICIRCSKLLIDKDTHKELLKKRGEARWREVRDVCSKIGRCGQDAEDGCGARQPTKYAREGIAGARIVAEWENLTEPSKVKDAARTRQDLEVEYILQLFRAITDEDVDFMGFSRFWCRPDWMICTILPIPPPQVRPSVVQENNQRSEDDLTHKLFEIIKYDKLLKQKIETNAESRVIHEMTDVVQYHIATLIDNQIPGVAPSAQRSGRVLKSVKQRLGSKEGRIRYNIQGKRVEFSARSVITPDPNISIAEIGVPMKIAMNLTRPDIVTPYNRDQLYRYVQNGPDKFPGAKTVIRKDGRMISLKHVNTHEVVLHYGDTVNRHLMDGDMLLFNRQPTLHKMSMMGHRVKVLPYNTFRMNVMVTSPYNADFDGDEMNAHIPQSYESSIELEQIAAVPFQIITPRDSRPIIGAVQDTLVGAYRLTRPEVRITRREFMNIMMWNKRFGAPEYANGSVLQTPREGALYTGHQVISAVLPPINVDITYETPNKEKRKITIRKGVLQDGQIISDVFSKSSKGIVHVAYNDCGPDATVKMLDSLQNTIEQFLIYNGFSVGISDLVADESTRESINKAIQARKKEVEELLLQVHLGLFENKSGKSNQEELETKIFATLNQATKDVGKIGIESLAMENRLIAMVVSGSKGKNTNVAQMVACVSQQGIEGKRIQDGFTDRTLPHYKKFDDSAEARGFVESSFIKGLTPQEFYFHAMSGREGLIDTAVKTAESGYIQRQLVKAMEDLVIQNDGTVRDAKMNILQFHYGEDGVGNTKLETQSLPLAGMSEADVRKSFGLEGADFSKVFAEGTVREADDTAAVQAYVTQVLADRRMLVENILGRWKDPMITSPVNLERTVLNVSVQQQPSDTTDLTPLYVLEGIRKVIERTQPYNAMWKALLRFHLAPHKMILERHFSRMVFDILCEKIILKNWQNQAQSGEQVGVLTAQSIGEPSTQMTLNSVDWDTGIIIAKNGRIMTPRIGEFIDSYYENCSETTEVQHLPNDQIYIPLDDGNDWKAMSCGEDGKMVWTKLEAITRHPVINADGSDTILEVTLASGRTVKATKAKSFLTRGKDGSVVGIEGDKLKVGDVLPIATSLAINDIGLIKEISLRELLSPTEWIYGTEANKAMAAMLAADAAGERHWFKNGIDFTVPYGRSDAFRDAFEKGRNTNAVNFHDGFIYPKRTRPDQSQIPETIVLDEEFGFFVGAYLAEGSANTTQINITNNNQEEYLARIEPLLKKWNVGYHIVCEERYAEKTNISGTSTSLVIHSTILSKVFGNLFGRLSTEKTFPDWVFQAPNVFVKALVDGYISGDGTIDKTCGIVSMSSASEKLIDGIAMLLARYGVLGRKSSTMPNVRLFNAVHRQYAYTISVYYSSLFYEQFHLTIKKKQYLLEEHFNERTAFKNHPNVLNDVMWDTVTSICEVKPMTKWVYDLTIEGTKNFTTSTLIELIDTFHLAGVAEKSNVIRGIPRLKELLKVSDNPKATSLTVYLKPQYRSSKDKVRELAHDLELTLLRDIVVKTAVYFDPKEDETVIAEDRDLLRFFKLFETSTNTENNANANANANAETEQEAAPPWSKWILRMEMDRERMFNKNICMDDIKFVLEKQFGDELNIVYSDFNSSRLVMRIRLRNEPDEKQTTQSFNDIARMKKMLNRLLTSVIIRGVPNIKSVTYLPSKEKLEEVGGVYQQVEEYVLYTDGSNMLEVINHPLVDATRTTTSHVYDVLNLLGIEAARTILLNEITSLFDDVKLNFRHLGLLCDVMTRAGRLMSIDRYGINKNDIGPLAKASFEETETILLRAALFGEMDPVTGVSANIMTGQPVRGGTAFSQIMLDEQAFLKMQAGLDDVPEDTEEEDAELTREEIDEALHTNAEDTCNETRLRINMTIPHAPEMLEEDDITILPIRGDTAAVK